jgi:hypothetical protein
MDDRWLETVDLCSGCFEKEVSHKGILHTMSHLMIETTRPIHDGEMAVLVPDAKQVARRVKREFKLLRVKPTCSSCNDPVALPCWVCMICGMSRIFSVEYVLNIPLR